MGVGGGGWVDLTEEKGKVEEEIPCVTSRGTEHRSIFQPLLLFNIHRYQFNLIVVFNLSESALPVKF